MSYVSNYGIVQLGWFVVKAVGKYMQGILQLERCVIIFVWLGVS